MLSEREITALRYYIGDTSGSDPFWSDPKAYVVLNSLFFPGIATEKARAGEGKYLNAEIIADTPRLAELLTDLLSSFGKCSADRVMTTYRVERYADYQLMKQQGSTVSFTSTSTSGFLDSYRDRKGIALMRFQLTADTPCIEMNKVLPRYTKCDEAEVLLPPRMELKLHEVPLTGDMLRITDADGQPPVVCVEVQAGELKSSGKAILLPDTDTSSGQRVYDALNRGIEPESADIADYITWKSQLISYIMGIKKD